MKENKKGFSLIELLATITILGILMGGAVIAVSKYLDKSRMQSYKTMEKSAYNAAQNYVIDEGITVEKGQAREVKISDLVNNGYLEKPIDPVNQSKDCTGSVTIKNNGISNDQIDSYRYKVEIKCTKYQGNVTYPKD